MTDLHIHIHPDSAVLAAIHDLKEKFMVTAAEVNAITAQVAKIGTETTALLQKVADLQTVIDSQGGVSAEVQAAFDALKAQVKVVDDMVPDTTP